MATPYIVKVENELDLLNFDVTVHHSSLGEASYWTGCYFLRKDESYPQFAVEYVSSDADGNHTFRIRGQQGRLF